MRSLALLVLAATLAVPTAHGAIVSYRFTATVERMSQWHAATATITLPTQTTFPGFTVEAGWSITGIASYDTEAPLDSYQPNLPGGGQHIRYNSSAGTSVSFAFSGGQGGFATNGDHGLEFANNASNMGGIDAFMLQGRPAPDATGMVRDALIVFNDPSGLALTSGDIVPSLSMEEFSYREFAAAWTREDGSNLWVWAPLTSWTLLTDAVDVPEPAGLALAATGLCLALVAGRRRHANQNTGT